MNQSTDPTEPPWTLRERVSFAWDEGSVRWLVGVLVVVILAVGMFALRSRPVETIAAPQIVRSGTPVPSSDPSLAPGSSASASTTAAEASGVVIVHVTGPVRTPGVVTLPAGSRVSDAVAAAGGVTAQGLKKSGIKINLARVLVDGEQIDVGATTPDAGDGAVTSASPGGGRNAPGSSAAPVQPGAKVSLNKATAAQLEELPRVGPVMAAKIIEFRTQYGGFRSIDQLREVSGIGDATFAQLAPLVQL